MTVLVLFVTLVDFLYSMPEPGQYGVRLRGTRLDGAVHESLYDYIIDYKRTKKRTKKELTIKEEAETFDEKGKKPKAKNCFLKEGMTDLHHTSRELQCQ